MIWKFDHAETLTWIEYDFWVGHSLPFGWSIISPPPYPRKQKQSYANLRSHHD